MDTPDHITQEDCSPKIRTREQQKDFFVQQAIEMMKSWNNLNHYDNPMDFFEEETDMMHNLLDALSCISDDSIKEIQLACEFYILHANTTLEKKESIFKALNDLTHLMIKITFHSSLIARRKHYYEQVSEKIEMMEELVLQENISGKDSVDFHSPEVSP